MLFGVRGALNNSLEVLGILMAKDLVKSDGLSADLPNSSLYDIGKLSVPDAHVFNSSSIGPLLRPAIVYRYLTRCDARSCPLFLK